MAKNKYMDIYDYQEFLVQHKMRIRDRQQSLHEAMRDVQGMVRYKKLSWQQAKEAIKELEAVSHYDVHGIAK